MITPRKRRPNFNLGSEKIKNILRFRAKGYTFQSLAAKFHLGSKQKVEQIIKENENKPEFATLYEEIKKTIEFLGRPL